MAKLNGIEIPTKGRIVWVRDRASQEPYYESPAIVLDGVDLAPDLFCFSRVVLPPQGCQPLPGAVAYTGPQLTVFHENEPSLRDGQLRWRWPPREEQPAAVATAPGEAQPSLEERVRQLEALIDEEPTANDKQKERLQRQLERKTIDARSYEADFKKLRDERDKALALVEETKKQLAANDAEHVERFAAETRRASALVEERDRLQGLLNEIARVFGNATVYDEARGDLVEKARIAHRAGAESEKLRAHAEERSAFAAAETAHANEWSRKCRAAEAECDALRVGIARQREALHALLLQAPPKGE